jgi:hypothetical protein
MSPTTSRAAVIGRSVELGLMPTKAGAKNFAGIPHWFGMIISWHRAAKQAVEDEVAA